LIDQDPLEPVTKMLAQLARTEKKLLDEIQALKTTVERLPRQFPKPLEPARPRSRFWPLIGIAVFSLCMGAGCVLAVFWWGICILPAIRPLAVASWKPGKHYLCT